MIGVKNSKITKKHNKSIIKQDHLTYCMCYIPLPKKWDIAAREHTKQGRANVKFLINNIKFWYNITLLEHIWIILTTPVSFTFIKWKLSYFTKRSCMGLERHEDEWTTTEFSFVDELYFKGFKIKLQFYWLHIFSQCNCPESWILYRLLLA